eukprot:COSAG05_NODE_3868_length_1798_cov_1.492643_2_plen_177_part_00
MEQAELRNAGVVEGVIELRLRRKLAEAEHRANVGRHRCRSLQLQLQRVEEVQRSQEHAAACLTMPLETESTAEQTEQGVPVHESDLRARCHELNQRAAAADEELAFTRQRLEDCELELPILRRRCALLQAEQDDEDVSNRAATSGDGSLHQQFMRDLSFEVRPVVSHEYAHLVIKR